MNASLSSPVPPLLTFGSDNMKTLFAILICTVGSVYADRNVDGGGFYPVLVQVVERESGTPIPGAKVHLADLPPYKEWQLLPERRTKVLPDDLGKVVTTDSRGVAVVFYWGRFASYHSEKESIYSRALVGTVVVEYQGKTIFRKGLEEWAKSKAGETGGAFSAAWIVVEVARTEKEEPAEQSADVNRPQATQSPDKH